MTPQPRYRRNPEVSVTELDGEVFLVEPDSQEVFYLDAMGAGLWRLIAEPQSLQEAVAVYLAAFPDADPETVESDLQAALRTLLDRGLAVAVP